MSGEGGNGNGHPMPPEEARDLRVEAVRRGHALGFSFTPLNGKKPVLKAWTTQPRASLEASLRWAAEGNVGLRTGALSGVAGVDIDPGARTEGRDFPATVTVETGGGGRHLYYRPPDGGIGNSVSRLADHIDIRGEGGQLVYPGSVHEGTGRTYRWAEGRSPDEIDIAPLPQWIVDALAQPRGESSRAVDERGTPYGLAALDAELRALRAATKGERNDQLNRGAFALAQLAAGGELNSGLARTAIEQVAAAWIGDDCTEDEVRRTIESGWRAGSEQPRAPASRLGGGTMSSEESAASADRCTDVGNAVRLVRRHGCDLRYCHPWKTWLVWDGMRWAEDKTGEVVRCAKETVASIYGEAAHADSESKRKSFASWATRSESVQRLKAMIEAAQSEPGIPGLPQDLDADPWLLSVQNGTLDLKTGELREHRREDLITKLAPVVYDPDASCPQWLRFLDQIMAGNPALAGYLQRLVGYWLTGDTREQCFWILHGTGANGKSVFVNTVRAMLGDYAQQTPAATFMAKREQAATNDLAKLRGARFVSAVESEDGQRLAESLVKQVTGQDSVTARFMFQEFFTFEPKFKVALATNHRPNIRGTDHAMWRRVRLIPFNVTIPDHEQDRELAVKLRDELPGILNWALEGLAMWLEDGSLRDPEEVLAATKEYRQEQDRIGEFIDERCVEATNQEVSAKEIYEAYQRWCEANGEIALKQKLFGGRLRERGHQSGRSTTTRRKVWRGIGLLPNGEAL